MVVRVARQALLAGAQQVVVATDSTEVVQACHAHDITTVLTRADHASGTDRLAEASTLLGLQGHDIVVNVQGDEPLIDPGLIQAVALSLEQNSDASMSTAAHPILDEADFLNPNVVKVVLDAKQQAMYFSRAPIAYARDALHGWPGGLDRGTQGIASLMPLRHVGIYAYRAAFLQRYPILQPTALESTEALEQLRALWHGYKIAVHVTAHAPAPGVDTPEDLERVRRLCR
jgi:3-deoxy-manno-octulosonate cytidylyltransferase (CMP-KDO synthetase)